MTPAGGTREISIDMRMLHRSGIGTYLRNLVPRVMAALPSAGFHLLGDPDELSVYPWTNGKNVAVVECRAPIYSVAEQLDLPRKVPRDADLLWSPNYNIPLLYRGKLLVTVHDVLFLAIPRFAGGPHKRLYVKTMFAAVRRRADATLCVSDFTKKEFVRLAGKTNGEVSTVHLGLDGSWFDVRGERRPHPRPFFLFVGNVKPHKNLKTLVEAFERVAKEMPHDLIVAGEKAGFITGDRKVAALAAKLGDRVRFTGYVGDGLLRQYYAHAEALVLPSLYEGFGFPPLEAMACGRPALVSNSASLPEVCGDAALYCDPYDPADLARKMRRLVNDAGLREALRLRGLERSRGFTWERCAEGTVEVIERVLREGKA